MPDRRILTLILLFTFPLPAEAQNPCTGLREDACRANPRCFWGFTSGYCVKNNWHDPAKPPAPSRSGPSVIDYLSYAWTAVAIASVLFLGWVLTLGPYGFFGGGRKPIKPYHEPDSPKRHLFVAYNYIKPLWDANHAEDVYKEMEDLTKAAEHIMHARTSDPASQIVVQEKNKAAAYTVDDLSFMVLYEEAQRWHAIAKQGNPEAFINKDYRRLTDGPKALEAINKTLRYRPRSSLALTLRAQILIGLGRKKDALQSLDEALTHDPESRAAQRLKDSL